MDKRETIIRKIRDLENSDPKSIDEFLKIEREINRLRGQYTNKLPRIS